MSRTFRNYWKNIHKVVDNEDKQLLQGFYTAPEVIKYVSDEDENKNDKDLPPDQDFRSIMAKSFQKLVDVQLQKENKGKSVAGNQQKERKKTEIPRKSIMKQRLTESNCLTEESLVHKKSQRPWIKVENMIDEDSQATTITLPAIKRDKRLKKLLSDT